MGIAIGIGLGVGLGLNYMSSTPSSSIENSGLYTGSTNLLIKGNYLGYFQSTARTVCSNIANKNLSSFESAIQSFIKNLSNIGQYSSNISISYTCK